MQKMRAEGPPVSGYGHPSPLHNCCMTAFLSRFHLKEEQRKHQQHNMTDI